MSKSPSWWSKRALDLYLLSSLDILDHGLDHFVDFVRKQVKFNLQGDPLFKAQWILRDLLKIHGKQLKQWEQSKNNKAQQKNNKSTVKNNKNISKKQ